MVPSIGPMELIVVLIIALLIFGPKRLPDMGRSLGHGMREFKESISGDARPDQIPQKTDHESSAPFSYPRPDHVRPAAGRSCRPAAGRSCTRAEGG